ncbi:MAG TPA: CAP domain-containing protein, partial [Propionibacteriaceae bacterium]|nr:CAP domain-containing protein [Propionibacteriaceae bacterium]
TTRTTTTTTTAPAPAVAPAVTQSSVTPRQDLASAVAAATNAQRVAAGLAPLSYRSCSVPAAWAVNMATTGTLVHNSLMTILTSCGGTTTAGENIAAGYTSVSAVTAGWMASPTHRANILNAKFKSISVGVAQAANGSYYWVEDFTG